MKTTIIYAHPWEESYNNAILNKLKESLESKKEEYNIIDLNKEGFSPAMTTLDLSGYSKGKFHDKKVGEYQNILKETKILIFIFPIWWYAEPAILKGFIDKVMLRDFSYIYGKYGNLIGQLTHIKKAIVYTTSGGPKWYIRFFSGNYINKVFKKTLSSNGIKNMKWYHLGSLNTITEAKRKEFLDKISI